MFIHCITGGTLDTQGELWLFFLSKLSRIFVPRGSAFFNIVNGRHLCRAVREIGRLIKDILKDQYIGFPSGNFPSGQNHSNLNCVSMHIFGVQNPKICIATQFKFLWVWPSKTSLWDSMMLILAAREILYTGPLNHWTTRHIWWTNLTIIPPFNWVSNGRSLKNPKPSCTKYLSFKTFLYLRTCRPTVSIGL